MTTWNVDAAPKPSGPPGLPSLRTLHRWLRADPDFARRDALLVDQLQTLAERAVPGTVTEAKALMAPI